MTPASAIARVSSAISRLSAVSVRSWPSSVTNASPVGARRTTIVGRLAVRRRLREQVIIKRVQRLAGFQHDEIGHIHHVADAADADFFERVRSQSGLGPIFTPRMTRAV